MGYKLNPDAGQVESEKVRPCPVSHLLTSKFPLPPSLLLILFFTMDAPSARLPSPTAAVDSRGQRSALLRTTGRFFGSPGVSLP